MADIEADIRQLREDIAALAKQVAATGEQSFTAARRAAVDGVAQLREQSEATFDTLRAGARDVEAEVLRSVREKPVTALAIAAGVGYLVALFTRR